MKINILTFIFLLCIIPGFSQSFVTPDKAWSNLKSSYYDPNDLSTEYLKFTNDTVINTLVYKKVERSTDENQQSWSDFGFIREDSDKKVFYKLNASEPEYLFYSFNIQLYDTITAYGIMTNANNFYMTPQLYFVVSVDSILIGETYRKRINLGSPEDTTYSFEQWIDSTGNTGGLLHNNNWTVGRDAYSLLCFSEDGIVKYQNPAYDSCYVVTGLDKRYPGGMTAGIYPNPAGDYALLTLPSGFSRANVSIIDSHGRTILKKSITTESDLKIPLTGYPAGLYLVLIENDNNNQSIKLLIE